MLGYTVCTDVIPAPSSLQTPRQVTMWRPQAKSMKIETAGLISSTQTIGPGHPEEEADVVILRVTKEIEIYDLSRDGILSR